LYPPESIIFDHVQVACIVRSLVHLCKAAAWRESNHDFPSFSWYSPRSVKPRNGRVRLTVWIVGAL
jgi:hypothetical protein